LGGDFSPQRLDGRRGVGMRWAKGSSFEERGSFWGIEEVVGPSIKALDAEMFGARLDGFLGGEVCGIFGW